jgi:nickel-dependent lactate racemase
VDLPDHWDVTVLTKKKMPVFENPDSGIAAAFAAPVGSGSVEREAAGCATACILICDITRPVPNNLVLRPLIERLLGSGMDPRRITILVATGLHRPNEGEELAALVADPWVLGRVKALNHFARRDEEHVSLGITNAGITARLDRRFVEADLRIAIGLVEPHFMAGWSGGRKLVLPGVAHASTIMAFHSTRMLSHPRAVTRALDGNPLHEAQREVLGMIGKTLAMNLVIDENRALSFASFGGIEESHSAAVAFADPYFRITVPRRFPVVLSSAAGFPLDANYYQTVKGMVCGASILEPGGELFVVSECSEGFGSEEFRRSQARLRGLGRDRFLSEAAARRDAEVDEWETVMLIKALNAGAIHLFTEGLREEDRSLSCVQTTADLRAELRYAVERDGGRRLAVIPEGPYIAPEVRSD